MPSSAASARDAMRPLGLLHGARGVFDIALEAMVWSSRGVLMAILLGLPIACAAVYRFLLAAKLPADVRGLELYGAIVAFYYVRNALPLAALFYAVSLVQDEVEDRTITYLLTRPIRRASILLGKFAAYLATTFTLTLPSIVITFFLLTTVEGLRGIGASVPLLFRDVGVIMLTLLSYGAFFLLLGVALRRPMIPGLLFLFPWELIANLPGYLPRFTLTIYLRSLVPYPAPVEWLEQLFRQNLPTLLCLEAIGGVIVLSLGAALWIFARKEYVLEQ